MRVNFWRPPSPGIAVVTYTVSRQTIGLLLPRPGIGIFQRTFFVSLHSTSGLAAGASPVPMGPRHVGQAWPGAAVAGAAARACGGTDASLPATADAAPPAASHAPATVAATVIPTPAPARVRDRPMVGGPSLRKWRRSKVECARRCGYCPSRG